MQGMTTSTHRDTALAHLAAVRAAHDHLNVLHLQDPANRAGIAKGYDEIRQGLKQAEVHALLAVAEAIEAQSSRPGKVGVTL